MNELNCLPKLFKPKAKAAIHNIWQAENKVDAEKAFYLFIETYELKYPKAALCLKKTGSNARYSSISQSNIGKVSAPAIQLNPPLPRSGTVQNAQRAVCHAMACGT
jgi:hypothetical protein